MRCCGQYSVCRGCPIAAAKRAWLRMNEPKPSASRVAEVLIRQSDSKNWSQEMWAAYQTDREGWNRLMEENPDKSWCDLARERGLL